MHYEADQFAADIPVIKYDEFDFEVHQPDMIFIHNLYVNTNFVTSVHPIFSILKISKNLQTAWSIFHIMPRRAA